MRQLRAPFGQQVHHFEGLDNAAGSAALVRKTYAEGKMNRRGFLQALAALGVSIAAPAIGAPRSGVGIPPEGVMVRAWFSFPWNQSTVPYEAMIGCYVNREFTNPAGDCLGNMKIGMAKPYTIYINSFLYDAGTLGLGFYVPKNITRWEVVDEPHFIRELQ